ncbi:MAG: SAM-dependent methyltransferase, partial [Gammaproteobacteria bacterium]|nr:SAM-dependent methyltransferase [Gammaproteobacteria bacterium]
MQNLSFNPLELFWDQTQWLALFGLYVLLMFPFFFAANCVGLVLLTYRYQINFSYAADLSGAALGAIGIVFILNWFFVEVSLQILVFCIALTAVISVLELKINPRYIIIAMLMMALPWLLPKSWVDLHPSEYKSLSQALNISGAHLLTEKSSPLAELSVVENQKILFRHAPGLSLSSSNIPGEQLGVFFDADSMSVITRFDGDLTKLAYLQDMTSALPYHLLQNPQVLILGAGGGTDVLQAMYHKARQIDAVELNQQMAELVLHDFADYAGNIYSNKNVNLHIAEARSFLQSSQTKYDLIQMALMDTFATSAAGLHALNESYLYTVEAMKLYLSRLTDNGYLAITRWVKLPPRDTLKLVLTARLALQQLGVSRPEQHISLIRSWNTTTLIVKKAAFTRSDTEIIVNFSRSRSFDIAYYPGINETETNQFNILPQPYFYQGTTALLSNNYQEYLANYKYDLQAATDDKPYFFNFLKWQTLYEILQLPAKQGLPLIEWGTIILIATFFQAIFASIIFILLPLWLHFRKQTSTSQEKHKSFTFNYFVLLGFAFMFIEIAFIQRFVLFLGHPTYAIAVVLTGFLLFAGIGSAYCKKWRGSYAIKIATIGILVSVLMYIAILPGIFNWGMNLP